MKHGWDLKKKKWREMVKGVRSNAHDAEKGRKGVVKTLIRKRIVSSTLFAVLLQDSDQLRSFQASNTLRDT